MPLITMAAITALTMARTLLFTTIFITPVRRAENRTARRQGTAWKPGTALTRWRTGR